MAIENGKVDVMAKEKRQDYYFTFCMSHANCGRYVKIHGTFGEAREKMFAKFGKSWAFQYSTELWFSDGVSQADEYGLTELKLDD